MQEPITLHLSLAELATINDALAARCAISTCPRPGHLWDQLNEEDYDRANQLEQLTFALYQTYNKE